ncbi:MAG: hypothetical protein KDA88_14680, partial [Planctomycetaceae bacterium]|nr:hypothetical protein [Planctomycetaceae bacterium]
LQWQNIDELHRIHMVPSSYNFVESNKSYEKQLLALIHDQLLNYDPVKDQLVPGLAKTYEVSPDGLRWTFRLRDAHTPDGSKLTADDVVFSFNLCLDSRFDCKQRGNLVLGNKPIKASAVSPLTVQFDLPQPFHSFDWALAGVTIVPSKTYSKVAETPETFRQAVGVQQPEAEFMLGFGPYYVDTQDTQEVRLVRNDRFWGRTDERIPRPYLKRITLVLRNEDVTSNLDFLHNDRYVYRMVGPMEAGHLKENTQFEILDRGLSGWCTFFWVNQNPHAPWGKEYPKRLELFQNVAFRRALAHAIDRQEIVHRVYEGYAEPLYGPVSPVYGWAASSTVLEEVTPETNVQAALSELAELGVLPGEPDADGKRWLTYEEVGGRIPLEIEIRTSKDEEDRRRKTAEEIKSQLNEIGIRVKVVEERFGEMVTRLDKTFDYEAAVMLLSGAPNPTTLKFFFESSGPMHFVNPYQKSPATEWERSVDEYFHTFATSPDPVQRERAILELQKTWSAAQPAFHLVVDRKLVAVRRDYEVNGIALTGRASDPILDRTVIENVRLRRIAHRDKVGAW